MGAYVLRRLGQSVVTIVGVMIVTFVLFRVVAGDIASVFVGQKGTEQAKADWRHAHGYDRPKFLNVFDRLQLTDLSSGDEPFFVRDAEDAEGKPTSTITGRLGLTPSDTEADTLLGQSVFALSAETPIEELFVPSAGKGKEPAEAARPEEPPSRPATTRPTTRCAPAPSTRPAGENLQAGIVMALAGGQVLVIDLEGVRTCGELMDRINNDPANRAPDGQPLVHADIAPWRLRNIFQSQFFDHLWRSLAFQARSLKTHQKISDIIADRAPRSLALTVPAMAIGWLAGMVIACFVAYYRGTLIDKVGVLLSVLGMCIPFLAFMIYGQWLMFQIAPVHAYGLGHRVNIYLPVSIMVVAGLGASVRFYRTVILDETSRDYVRTARAKGASVPSVLFKHVLKNCMLPILTNLILAIPFLIMGSLLVETYFGIPGLGDLMLTSINDRDEPIMSAMVFLTALIYTLGLLATDISYAVFDPRVRLR